MNVKELQEAIALLLTAELGSYTLPNNTTTPAIHVLDIGESIPLDWKVSGLECVIQRSPSSRSPQATFDGIRRIKRWQIYLIQWERGAYTLGTALDRLEQRFAGVRSFSVGVSEQRGVKAQVSVRIVDDTEGDDWI